MKPCILRNEDNTIKQVSAPNGKPSKAYEALYNKFGDEQTALRAYANMYTPEFQAWFKGSKVVDENGEPKIVYLDNTNTDPDIFILGENKISNIPMFISSKDPEINEDGSYNVYDINEVQDAFNGYKESDYTFTLKDVKETDNVVISNSNYGNLLNYKRKLYFDLNERLKKIKNSLDMLEKNLSNPTVLNQYKNLTKFRIQTEKLIKKTKNELIDLENRKEESIIKEILDKDLSRLNYLGNLKNITISEYFEAKRIMDFFEKLIPETGVSHPFYSEESLFDEDGNSILDKNILAYFESIQNASIANKSKIIKLRNNLATFIVNNDAAVKNLYDEKLKYEELIKKDEGLADATWVDKMFYDITMNLFTNNGHIAEVMFTTLNIDQEQELKKAEVIHNKIDKILPNVIKVLKKDYSLGFGKLFENAVSFEIFKQKDEFGFETGSVITKYSNKYENELANIHKLFDIRFAKARKISNPTARKNAFNKAADTTQNWYRENTIQVDIRKIPEIWVDEEFKDFNDFFIKNDNGQHVNELKKLLTPEEYSDLIKKQKSKLFTYKKQKEIYSQILSEEEFNNWNLSANPFTANAYFYDNIAIDHETNSPTMAYNVMIPRKNKANIVEDVKTGKLKFEDSNTDLGFYDKDYEKIAANKDLKEFHDIILEILTNIHENLPLEYREKTKFNTVMAMDKAMTELVLESTSMFDGYSKIFKRLKNNFLNALSGKLTESIDLERDPEIRADFISNNKKEIDNLYSVAKAELEYLLGTTINDFTKIYTTTGQRKNQFKYLDNQIAAQEAILNNPNSTQIAKDQANSKLNSLRAERNSILTYDKLAKNSKAVKLLSELLGVEESIDAIKDRLNNKDGVLLNELLKSIATDEIMRQKSFDLPKVLKNYATLAAKFKAKNNAKPIVDVLKDVYKEIKTPVNDGDKDKQTKTSNLRIFANEQLESWYLRNIIGDENAKMKYAFFTKYFSESEGIKKSIETAQALFNGTFGKYYKEEEKKVKDKLDALLKDKKFLAGLTKEEIAEFEKLRDNLGQYYGPGFLLDGLNTVARLIRLGYNALSALGNRMEGELQNMILVDLGYMSKESYYRAINIARQSFLKNLSFGLGTKKYNLFPEAVKLRTIVDKLQKLQDSKNELQKSTHKSVVSKSAALANPFELNTRVEYLNQSQLMAATLMDIKIKDKDGNESSVWDALNPDGTLKPQFKVGANGKENIMNWELMKGDDFKVWSTNTEGMINLGHGNYNTLRGMMVKQSRVGKSMMMFRSWMPMNIASKIATEQESAILGKKKFKGRYLSYTAPTLFATTAIYATTAGMFSSVGALMLTTGVGGLIAYGTHNLFQRAMYKRNGEVLTKNQLPKTSMNTLEELFFYTKMLGIKALGYPINRVFGKDVSSNVLSKFNISQGDYKDFVSKDFTLEDAKNMNANATEAALTVQRLLLLSILQRAIMSAWEWEEDEDRPWWYNLIVNTLNNLNRNLFTIIQQIPSFLDVTEWAPSKVLVDIFKTTGNAFNWVTGGALGYHDTITDGPNKGGSYLGKSIRKLLPGTFKDATELIAGGTPDVLSKTWDDSPFEKIFEKAWKEQRKQAKIARMTTLEERLDELERRKAAGEKILYFEEDIKKQVDKEIPLPNNPTRHLRKAYREYLVKIKDDTFNEEFPNMTFIEYLQAFSNRYPNVTNNDVVKYVINREAY